MRLAALRHDESGSGFFAGIKYRLPCQVAKIGIKWPKIASHALKGHNMANDGIAWLKMA